MSEETTLAKNIEIIGQGKWRTGAIFLTLIDI